MAPLAFAFAMACLRMHGAGYTQLAQPIVGTPLCLNDQGNCKGCAGVQTEYGQQLAAKKKARHRRKQGGKHRARGYQRG